MAITVVAEKPSVARDLARALGATRRDEGFLEGSGYRVTWAIGHLVGLAEPHEMRPEWKRWSRELLPMLPKEWPLAVFDKTRSQFEVVKRLMNAPDTEHVVCATDAGREGELIFRLIHEAAKCRKPVKRLWISSLTDDAIRDGFKRLRDGKAMDPLARAAHGRSRADWLVGMNLSRAYGLSLDAQLSVGRVQTPTLAMLVERELAIRNFVPEAYVEVVATFSPHERATYDGTWFRPDKTKEPAQQRRLPADGVEAAAIVERVKKGEARIASHTSETKRMPPPPLYDLTELQRHANRLFGFTAQRTLELAQSLYETHKVLSYPRTDSRHLSHTVAATLGGVVDAIRDAYESQLAPGTGERALGKRHVDDAQVSDHHAIIPTNRRASGLERDERRIYDLVCRRLLQAWHDDFVWAATTVITEVRSPDARDLFRSTGTAVEQQGWKVLDLGSEKKAPKKKGAADDDEPESDQSLPPGLAQGQQQRVVDAKSVAKKTRPPPRLTDASLLTAMERAGRSLDEEELSRAMRDSGLGTPATRAAIIETLLQRGYVERTGKTFEATEKGIGLIEVVDPEVKSPVMTGQWEARLQAIERGEGDLAQFMEGIERYVRDVIGRVPAVHPKRMAGPPRTTPTATAALRATSTTPTETVAPRPPIERTPTPPDQLTGLLKRVFGFDGFRPHQEAVCRAATEGRDVLLVMPTGAGKSLCYQLPGLARGGTTLVVSPLIALMEDQVAKLRNLGVNAQCIHSGRDRAASRQACREYLDGTLDVLFIAPERLGVTGFPELLAKRTPSLVAIDEAHCISQWGHDFRPDYRLLGERLPMLRPAPVVAVTATATPTVQQDIAEQLGLGAARTFIHGFRRTNIAIEVQEAGPRERVAIAAKLLAGKDRLPAILYAPTRKRAEEVAKGLAGKVRCAAYHAGMTADAREKVQSAFLGGKLDAVVATVAFGMGVDKADVRTVVHLALPSSVEGYYQEIGRAGRDGKESRAVLLQSYADRRTHEFFHERDYPEPEVLQRIFDALSDKPIQKETLRRKTKIDSETLDKALEKLWMQGGAFITPDETVQRGRNGWQASYGAQRDQRANQVVLMGRFTESHACRMLQLVRHFGDREDSGAPCGLCDVCAPGRTLAVAHRDATPEERQLSSRILEALRTQDQQSTGRVCRQLLGEEAAHRRTFETALGGLVRAGLVRVTDDAFEKDGKRITFQRASLTSQGRIAGPQEIAAISMIAGAVDEEPRARRGKKGSRGARKPKGSPGSGPSGPAKRRRREATASDDPLATSLRAWRLAEAKRRRVPAFRIFTDRVLEALLAERPADQAALLNVSGVGPKLAQTHGAALIAVLTGAPVDAVPVEPRTRRKAPR